jgi:DNA-binding response OmpR family regulator/DNA-binding HxlR family transcriptional regulator
MRILIVDDNKTFLEKLEKILILERHEIRSALSGKEALKLTSEQEFDLLLTDLKMGDISGIDLIRILRDQGLDIMSIVITGYGTIDSAVEAMKTGAYDYILKPFEISNLKAKIKEVERELRLREILSQPVIIDESLIKDSIAQIKIEEYSTPFLIVSDVDSKEISLKIDTNEVSTVRIGYNDGVNTISPSKLHLIHAKIEEFVTTQKKGTIIFKGIEELVKTHKWAYVKRFIDNIHNEILSFNFSMIILVNDESESTDFSQSLLHDALSLLSVQAFDNIVSIISHPLRKSIINLLKPQGKLNFNKIIEDLEVESSSGLAFHIKKLVQEEILTKEDNLYLLTERGQYFGEIIYLLEKIGFSDPGSRVKVLKYIKNRDRSPS